MGAKYTGVLGLFLLVPITIIVVIVVISIKCASCCATTWDELVNWIRGLWMRVQWPRYLMSRSRRVGERSGSSSSSIAEVSRDVEMEGDRRSGSIDSG